MTTTTATTTTTTNAAAAALLLQAMGHISAARDVVGSTHCQDCTAYSHLDRGYTAVRKLHAAAAKRAANDAAAAKVPGVANVPAPQAAQSMAKQDVVQTSTASPTGTLPISTDAVDVAGMGRAQLTTLAAAHGIRLPLGAGVDRIRTVITAALTAAKPAVVAVTPVPAPTPTPAPVAAPAAVVDVAAAIAAGTLGAMKAACTALRLTCDTTGTGTMRAALTAHLNGTPAPAAVTAPAATTPVAPKATAQAAQYDGLVGYNRLKADCKAAGVSAKGTRADLLARLTAKRDAAKPAPVAAQAAAPAVVKAPAKAKTPATAPAAGTAIPADAKAGFIARIQAAAQQLNRLDAATLEQLAVILESEVAKAAKAAK